MIFFYFTQFAVFQINFVIPFNYIIFLIILVTSYKDVKLFTNVSILFSIIFILYLFSLLGFQSVNFREIMQFSIEIFISKCFVDILSVTDKKKIVKGIDKVIVLYFIFLIIFILDYLVLKTFAFTSAIEYLTLWVTSFNSGLFPKTALLWANPNWLSLFISILLISRNLLSKTVNSKINFIGFFILFYIFSKTAVAITFFIVLLQYLNFNKIGLRNSFFLIVSVIIIFSISQYFYESFLITNESQSLTDTASFKNRLKIFEYVAKEISFYPKGLPDINFIQGLIVSSYEDTIPSTLLTYYIFGYVISSIFILYIFFSFFIRGNKFLMINTAILYGLTYSFLSVTTISSILLTSCIYFYLNEK